MSRYHLSEETLDTILDGRDVAAAGADGVFDMVRGEEDLLSHLPDGRCQIDPRDGTVITFNASRAKRPHDNAAVPKTPSDGDGSRDPVCLGKTTRAIDVAPLSEGFTFINKNLFPILHPGDHQAVAMGEGLRLPPPAMTTAQDIYGTHLLQWTSNYFDRDWHNLAHDDRVVAMQRLAVLERTLLFPDGATQPHGHVGIIKNYGRLVGGSLEHGHQQILHTNAAPRRIRDHQRFLHDHGEKFADHMLRDNPESLLIRDYGSAVLVVPYFMRRPYDMQLLLRDTSKQYLHQLDEVEIGAVADAWCDATRAFRAIMPAIGRHLAYNVIMHTGPGAGFYNEFLPYTQETGGFEHLGLYVCQASPQQCAEHLRGLLADLDRED